MTSFSPTDITMTGSASVDARVCVVLTELPVEGSLECDIDITLSPTGDTAGLFLASTV